MFNISTQSTPRENTGHFDLRIEVLITLIGSLFIALSSQVSFILPWTTIPVSLQSLAVLFVSLILGRKRALASISAYLLEGVIGAPVFALGGAGIGVILGPRGGYLLSYLLVSYFIGEISDRSNAMGRIQAFFFFAIANCIILTCGWLWLSQFTGFQAAWILGVCPFILSDFFKITILTILLPGITALSYKIRG